MLYLSPTSSCRRTTPPASVGDSYAARPHCPRALPTSPTARPHGDCRGCCQLDSLHVPGLFLAPRGNRQLYRLVKRHTICRIVEIGISNLARAESLIQVAQRFAGDKKVWYTGLDMFEARALAARRSR